MGRTWLLRGVAVAVFAVVAGAWALGLAQLDNSPSSGEKPTTPVSSDNPKPTLVEKTKPRRTREPGRPLERLTEPSTDPTSRPTDDDASGTPAPTSTAPAPDPPGPSQQPTDPSPPPHTPTTPPSEPTDDCTDLVAALDCLLNPITGQP